MNQLDRIESKIDALMGAMQAVLESFDPENEEGMDVAVDISGNVVPKERDPDQPL